MAYVYPNLPSKKAVKEAIASGATVTVKENTPWGSKPITDGNVTLEGPHYPQPHKWYGSGVVKDGKLVSIR
jgi:hypothetical protein